MSHNLYAGGIESVVSRVCANTGSGRRLMIFVPVSHNNGFAGCGPRRCLTIPALVSHNAAVKSCERVAKYDASKTQKWDSVCLTIVS